MHTETDESGNSEHELDNSTRFAFNIIVPDDSSVNNKYVSEEKNDAIAAGKEHERVISKWIEP